MHMGETKTSFLSPVIKANSFLYTYCKQYQHLYIDPNSYPIQNYTQNFRIFEEAFIKTQPSNNQTRNCLPFILFYAAFDKPRMVTPVKKIPLTP